MSGVDLPFPRRRGEPAPSAPRYEIRSVMSDGSEGPVEILPVTRPPWKASAGRRGFLGAGVATSVAVALLASGCKSSDATPTPSDSDTDTGYGGSSRSSGSSSSGSGSSSSGGYGGSVGGYTSSSSGGYSSSSGGYSSSSGGYDTPTPTDNGDSGDSGSTGGMICTCNKVCTCIPVCQAHRLLDPDPGVRAMAAAVLHEMGPAEGRYLEGAAAEAAEPLAARIRELTADIVAGRGRPPLPAPESCVAYLDADDPVTALMAAQVLAVNALRRGTGLTGRTGERAAALLREAPAMRWTPGRGGR